MAKTHKDLEFHVQAGPSAPVTIFKTFDAAVAHAVMLSSIHCNSVNVDVITWSEKAAKVYAGDYGVEQYRQDPDASVHDRIVIKAHSEGRIA